METTPPQSGNIETLLGYKGKDLALMTDDELRANFKDVFDFEKSLRDTAGLIKAEMPSVKDEDASVNEFKTSAPAKPRGPSKSKQKTLLAVQELINLQRELGMNTSNVVKPPKPV